MSHIEGKEEHPESTVPWTATGTAMYNMKRNLDDGTVKDSDYARLLVERFNTAITLLDKQEEGINAIKAGGREIRGIKSAMRTSCHEGRAKIRCLRWRVNSGDEKTAELVDLNKELGYIVRSHSWEIAESMKYLKRIMEDYIERASAVLNWCDLAAEITKGSNQAVDHLEELLAKTTLEGPLGATKAEFDILYGESEATARHDSAGTEDRRGGPGEEVVEGMDASGWPLYKVSKSGKDKVRIGNCKPQ